MSAFDAVDGARSAASKCYRLVASTPKRFKEVRPGNDDGVWSFDRTRPMLQLGQKVLAKAAAMSGSGLLPCKLTPEAHFASR
jgi:hypothetical protein